jgi:cytochrome c oxidase subunit 2
MVGKLVAAVSFALLPALVAAGGVLAAPGGIGPPGPETPSGEAISQLYWIVFGICAVVFVLVESTLILFIIRYRRRRDTPETAEGPQIHGNTRIEIIWTLVPAVILIGLAAFTFTRIPAVQAKEVKSADSLEIRVEAHQFYWQYVYPNGAISLDDLYLPEGRPVALHLDALDVIHSWWVPALTGKLDAIPGRNNVLRFVPERRGTYEGKCAELCGVQHAVMLTTVHVLPRDEYDTWVEETASAQQSGGGLGRETWNAVCAKCHGLDGQGDIGPAIAGNGTLTNEKGLRDLLLNGQNTPQFEGYMPPVAIGWPDHQFQALIDYIKSQPSLSRPAPVTAGGGG